MSQLLVIGYDVIIKFDRLCNKHLTSSDARTILEVTHHLNMHGINPINKPNSGRRTVSGESFITHHGYDSYYHR